MGGDRWATQWWVQVQLADAAKDGLWDRVNANEEKFTDPTIQGAIETYKGLIDEGLFNEDIKTATFEDQGAALLAGDAAMVVQVNSFFGQLQSQGDTAELDEKIGFFPISPVRQRRHVHPRPVQRARRLQDRRRQAGGGGAPAPVATGSATATRTSSSAQSTVSLQDGVATPGDVPRRCSTSATSLGDSVGSMQALAIANPDLYIFLG